jgi:multidrug efflux pump subunit AcrA (membrane-fusion protein)
MRRDRTWRRRATRIGLLSFVLLALPVAGSWGHEHGVLAALPGAPEKELVLRHCTACHGLERVQGSGGSVSGWEDRIQRMIRWGANIAPGEITSVAAYLAQALPVRLRPAAGQAFFANTAISSVEVRSIQTILRAAAWPDATGMGLTMTLDSCAGSPVRVGQRARVFPVTARALMKPAKVQRVKRQQGRCSIALALEAPVHDPHGGYLVELPHDLGQYLSVVNDALIEEAGAQRVYVQDEVTGEYRRREVRIGLQGEQYAQVLTGLSAGEQVVTLGSSLIDAEYRMQTGDAVL